MGIAQCIYLLEHINYQLVYEGPTADQPYLSTRQSLESGKSTQFWWREGGGQMGLPQTLASTSLTLK